MFKPTYTRTVPAGSKTRITDGKTEVFISHDGKMQWFPLSKGGRARIPHKDWHGQVKLADGRTITIRLVRNKEAAQRILLNRQLREDNIASGKEQAIATSTKAVSELIEQFEKEQIAKGTLRKSLLNSIPILRKASAALFLETMQDVRALTEDQIANWWLDLDRAPGTKAKYLETLAQFMRWLQSRRLLTFLPKFPKPSTKVTKKRRALTFEDTEQLANASPWPRSILYRLGFCTLARRSALLALRVDDLFFAKDGATMLLRPEESKTGQGQQVPIPGHLVKDLKRLASEAGSGLLFEKVPKNNFAKTFDIDLKSAKILKNTPDGIACFHSLRHGGTTHLIRSGVPLSLVQQMGGWSTITILAKHYAHLSPISDREHIDRAMTPKPKKKER